MALQVDLSSAQTVCDLGNIKLLKRPACRNRLRCAISAPLKCVALVTDEGVNLHSLQLSKSGATSQDTRSAQSKLLCGTSAAISIVMWGPSTTSPFGNIVQWLAGITPRGDIRLWIVSFVPGKGFEAVERSLLAPVLDIGKLTSACWVDTEASRFMDEDVSLFVTGTKAAFTICGDGSLGRGGKVPHPGSPTVSLWASEMFVLCGGGEIVVSSSLDDSNVCPNVRLAVDSPLLGSSKSSIGQVQALCTVAENRFVAVFDGHVHLPVSSTPLNSVVAARRAWKKNKYLAKADVNDEGNGVAEDISSSGVVDLTALKVRSGAQNGINDSLFGSNNEGRFDTSEGSVLQNMMSITSLEARRSDAQNVSALMSVYQVQSQGGGQRCNLKLQDSTRLPTAVADMCSVCSASPGLIAVASSLKGKVYLYGIDGTNDGALRSASIIDMGKDRVKGIQFVQIDRQILLLVLATKIKDGGDDTSGVFFRDSSRMSTTEVQLLSYDVSVRTVAPPLSVPTRTQISSISNPSVSEKPKADGPLNSVQDRNLLHLDIISALVDMKQTVDSRMDHIDDCKYSTKPFY